MSRCIAGSLRASALILAIAISSPCAIADDEPYPFDTFVSSAFGQQYTVTIPEDSLAAMPKWLDSDPNPPVSAKAALQAARKLADRLIGKQPEYRRYLDGITLKPVEGGWVWVVRFDWIYNHSASGIPPHLIVVVPMDGKPIAPKVTPLSEVDPFEPERPGRQ